MASNPVVGQVEDPISGEQVEIRVQRTGERLFYADWDRREIKGATFAEVKARLEAELQPDTANWQPAIWVTLYAYAHDLPLNTLRRIEVAVLNPGQPGERVLRRGWPGSRQSEVIFQWRGEVAFPGTWNDGGNTGVLLAYTEVTWMALKSYQRNGWTLHKAQREGLLSLVDGDVDGAFSRLESVHEALNHALRGAGFSDSSASLESEGGDGAV